MRIVTILGSPKKKGNTATLLSLAEEKLRPKHEVERIHVTRHKVNGCLGCYKCKEKTQEPGCVQKDDALEIFQKMIQADAIVYASPLYCWNFTAQIKPLIDRHFCLVSGEGTTDHDSLLRDKPVALLATCAGPVEQNCDGIKHTFRSLADYLKAAAKGEFILPLCTTPDAIGEEGQKVAQRLAAAIAD